MTKTSRLPRKLFYQLLTIKINELEFKKQFKCIWVNSSKLKEERELLLYPNKSGTVSDLLDEAKKYLCEQVYFSNTLSAEGSGKLRLLEITSNRIMQILKEDVLVECLNTTTCKSYRVEVCRVFNLSLLKSRKAYSPFLYFFFFVFKFRKYQRMN